MVKNYGGVGKERPSASATSSKINFFISGHPKRTKWGSSGVSGSKNTRVIH